MRCTLPICLFLAAFGSTACATGIGSADPSRGNRNLIVLEELDPGRMSSAHDAIRLLRPRWLQANRTVSLEALHAFPKVVVDGVSHGDLDTLHRISVDAIREMRFLSAADATMRYGTGFQAGAIEITTR